MAADRNEVNLSSGPLSYFTVGSGRPLLYLHSAGGPAITPFIEGLADKHRVVMPIAPGFDGTPQHDKIASIEALAGLYAEFAAKVIGAPYDVMGHSFGGWVALWLVIKQPQTVEQLVLEAPAGLRYGAVAGPPPDPAEVRRRLYAYPQKAEPFIKPPDVGAANMQAFGRYNRGIFVDEALLARLPDIHVRTLIVMATKDEMIPAKTGHVLKEKIPASHLTYIYDAAHAIEIDQPEHMLRLVKAFLERGEAYIVNFGGAAA